MTDQTFPMQQSDTRLPLEDLLKMTIGYNADLLHYLHGPKNSAFERVRPALPAELFDRLPKMFMLAGEDDVFGSGARDFLKQADERNGRMGVPVIIRKKDEEEEEVQ